MSGEERAGGGGSVWQGFKAFLMRGNVIDLAVAVVIGAAFTNYRQLGGEGVSSTPWSERSAPRAWTATAPVSRARAPVPGRRHGRAHPVGLGAGCHPHVRDHRGGRLLHDGPAHGEVPRAAGGPPQGEGEHCGRSSRSPSWRCSRRSGTRWSRSAVRATTAVGPPEAGAARRVAARFRGGGAASRRGSASGRPRCRPRARSPHPRSVSSEVCWSSGSSKTSAGLGARGSGSGWCSWLQGTAPPLRGRPGFPGTPDAAAGRRCLDEDWRHDS